MEGPSKKNSQELCGRTENNRVVNFAGPQNLAGQMVDVVIAEAMANSLRGRLVFAQSAASTPMATWG